MSIQHLPVRPIASQYVEPLQFLVYRPGWHPRAYRTVLGIQSCQHVIRPQGDVLQRVPSFSIKFPTGVINLALVVWASRAPAEHK